MFAAFLESARANYRRVLFLGGGGTDLLSSRWSVEPLASDRFQIPEYESAQNAYPRSVKQKEFEYSVYAFGPPVGRPAANELDVGVNDDLNVDPLSRQGGDRRTDDPLVAGAHRSSSSTGFGAGDRTLALWMNDGGRPAAAPPADVTVSLDDRGARHRARDGGVQGYAVADSARRGRGAAATGEPVRITLRTATWNPRTVLGTADDRDSASWSIAWR